MTMYYVIQFLTVHRYPHPINLKTANGPSTADFRKIFEVSQIFPLLCVLYTQLSLAYSLHCSFADINLSSVGSAGLVFPKTSSVTSITSAVVLVLNMHYFKENCTSVKTDKTQNVKTSLTIE